MKSVQDYLHTKDEHIMCRKASLFIFILGVKSKLEKLRGRKVIPESKTKECANFKFVVKSSVK